MIRYQESEVAELLPHNFPGGKWTSYLELEHHGWSSHRWWDQLIIRATREPSEIGDHYTYKHKTTPPPAPTTTHTVTQTQSLVMCRGLNKFKSRRTKVTWLYPESRDRLWTHTLPVPRALATANVKENTSNWSVLLIPTMTGRRLTALYTHLSIF